MIVFWRALMAMIVTCFGLLLVMLACFPLGLMGVLHQDRYGIEVPPLLLIVSAIVIWLGALIVLTAKRWEP